VIAEAEKTSYPGVVCSHCGAVIPVTGKPAKLYARSKELDSDVEDSKTQSFPLRCSACEKEGVYPIGQIREFEGSPKVRRQRFSRKERSPRL
jgi:hypothetical protein